ncbi:MAG: glucose dehydrogenase [Candidatus Viridilinea halotolerans]|uniref:Glucose dehydrogenase n=1 Tax=Candidatus Viridilinea halotolerans TaxID=2491704 RepID=A0A426TYR1_9CHLR|nr:MAG: glucose dehydrogenase [Candidatus Viridilinea halotolerans]
MRYHKIFAFLLVVLLLSSCGITGQAAAPTVPLATIAPTGTLGTTPSATAPLPMPTETAVTALNDISLQVELLADGFNLPTQVTHAGDERLFVVEQDGRIWVLRAGVRALEPFLDIADRVGAAANEQGLLSVAFHPRFAELGWFFVNYTDRQGDTVVARYQRDPTNPERADPNSAMVLLQIAQPAANHNGGQLKFGPDGYLYIGTGDGGNAGDPWNNAQNLSNLLGKLLRIDVDGVEPYEVPTNNPFVGQSEARPEIWAYGLRNPWRFAFDRATGDLFIADVGQSAQEEVNFQPAASRGGENYGWRIMEGTGCYEPAACDPAGLELPIAHYLHRSAEGGCSITGGYVYRGMRYPALQGAYLYTDYCSGNLWLLHPTATGWQSRVAGKTNLQATSFGEGVDGELYLVDRAGGVYRLGLDEPLTRIWLPLVQG